MPMIDLTDDQADVLRDVLVDYIAETDNLLAGYEDDFYPGVRRSVPVLKEVLHLLEIA